jgi:hypothetical protein
MSLEAVWLIPSDAERSGTFSFSNMDEHVKASLAVFKKYGVNLQLYPLDPMPPVDSELRGLWAYQHQAMHNDLDAVLGVGSGPDLSSIDWNSREQLIVWAQLHAPRHMLYAQTLGLT